MKKQLTLFLMTKKGYEVLEALGVEFAEIVDFVVIGRDKSVQNDYSEEIKKLCDRLKIVCYDRSENFEIKTGFAMAVSWRWLLNLPETKLIIFHDSLLPKYRGFNPLVSYLINGEKKIGVTALFAAEDYDRGEIIAQTGCEISYPIKISEAINLISREYAKLARDIAGRIFDGKRISGILQDESEATYSLWRDDEDYQIDWNLSAKEIKRFVDAVGFPYKGASTFINGRKARVNDAEEVEDVAIENRCSGKVVFIRNSNPVVVCGSGLLKITSLTDNETGVNLLPIEKFRTRFK